MARSKSSGRWLKEHFDDQYVKQSQKDGYRSRASYKLLEIQEKDRILRPGMSLVDLGAAPGGWCQVAAKIVGEKGRIVASDILDMDPIADVAFVKGDFTEETVLEQILQEIGSEQVDLVISDMAPNMSGMTAVDQPKAMYLAELALDMARQVLKPGGAFLTKVFQGEGFDEYFRDMRGSFDRLQSRKPQSSRPRSREIYLLARGFKGQ
ncbi:23S rRNA (uridine(2552)-2'-O)-methyltransferase RlmE [Aestuariirhabdus sp. Z084]|uniref:23S rRNA (uridine(2552)-2'-O)-methyltransferase RlmE n=1 Tax=Aestuariirhabdus haliotis TaxID=2918751 RepID=UPI00201B3834|nr:23S rRNA (uridine(2552)-2'-O)-methyltransferase RlmE [Aestuariirhabdus haliotis]MCL6415437.1 23S rRNA (uridine(2552)-2'-O)-methyltransferase RlmE [Aestuariirhabdus haliotis]MCL6419193.1 23S rRNA (uridine(2552)-2'-O)-methyltransferase RlmE [Aestuariirhabdus haliotis]